MRARNGFPRQQSLVLFGVLAAPACAVAIEDPVAGVEMAPTAGLGGSIAGMSGLGGNATAGTGGALNGGTGGASGGGGGGGGGTSAGTGGTNASSGASGIGGGSSGTGGGGAGTAAAGKGGGAGKGGAGGKGGSGGTGGASGKGGSGGSGTGTEASGCAELSVPLNGANDKAHFVISLTSVADLSDMGTTISMRIYVESGTGGRIFLYAQDSDFNFLAAPAAMRPLLAEQQGWVTLTWNIAAEPAAMSGMAKTQVKRIGIEIQAAPSMDWSNPTVVYVDSISVNSPALSFGFGMNGTVSASANQTTDPNGQSLWLNAGSMDTTATGSSVDWVATCP